jgi:hypothetical protein
MKTWFVRLPVGVLKRLCRLLEAARPFSFGSPEPLIGLPLRLLCCRVQRALGFPPDELAAIEEVAIGRQRAVPDAGYSSLAGRTRRRPGSAVTMPPAVRVLP